MRITIENTVYEPEYAKKLIIELPADDISLPEMFRIYADALYLPKDIGWQPESCVWLDEWDLTTCLRVK